MWRTVKVKRNASKRKNKKNTKRNASKEGKNESKTSKSVWWMCARCPCKCFHDKWPERKKLPRGTIKSVNYRWSQCTHSRQCACSQQWEVTPPVVPMLQASVCDEQLMSIGGEIALSGNKKWKNEKNQKMKKIQKIKKMKKSKKNQRNRKITIITKKTKTWTPQVALCPSGVLLVCNNQARFMSSLTTPLRTWICDEQSVTRPMNIDHF